ncbi:MAG: DNA translocase FtsK 4TM domain-containing protein, partial [Armatimonadota bacterium]
MPTEGLSRRGNMPSNKKKTRRPGTDKAVVEVEEAKVRAKTHHNRDIIAVSLIGLGIVILLTLAMGQGGLLGNGLTLFFTTLFGKGAWAVPVVLMFAGGCLLTGRANFQAARVTWGALIGLLGMLGLFAGAHANDYFDPEVMRATGGMLGALMGWAGDSLLGASRGVLYVVFILAGLILCLERPLHEWADRISIFGRKAPARQVEEVDTDIVTPEDLIAERRRKAAIELLETPLNQVLE